MTSFHFKELCCTWHKLLQAAEMDYNL